MTDGTLAANGAQADAFWQLREGLNEAQHQQGRHLRTDVSIPVSTIASFLEDAHAELGRAEPEAVPVAYGHLGDGNIHFNVLAPPTMGDADRIALLHRCERIIFRNVDAADGSISAEHGIGLVKRGAFLERAKPLDLDLLRRIKSALDPRGAMNPGRIFDSAPRTDGP